LTERSGVHAAPSVGDPVRRRDVVVERFPPARKVSLAALRAGRGRVAVHGLVEMDVTEARLMIDNAGTDLSFTAFMVASVARAAASNPKLHCYRDWRGRVVSHTHVDVTTMVETQTDHGPWPLAIMLRDADRRSVADLTAQLRRVQADPSADRSGRLLKRAPAALARLPGLARLGFWIGDRTRVGRRATGTIGVSAIGMFGDGGGYGIAAPTLYTLGVVVGGIAVRPRIVDGEIVARDVVDLTITVDHRLVDGGPAARFGSELRWLVECAAVLQGTEHQGDS